MSSTVVLKELVEELKKSLNISHGDTTEKNVVSGMSNGLYCGSKIGNPRV